MVVVFCAVGCVWCRKSGGFLKDLTGLPESLIDAVGCVRGGVGGLGGGGGGGGVASLNWPPSVRQLCRIHQIPPVSAILAQNASYSVLSYVSIVLFLPSGGRGLGGVSTGAVSGSLFPHWGRSEHIQL